MISVRVEQLATAPITGVFLLCERPDVLIFRIDTKKKYPIAACSTRTIVFEDGSAITINGINLEDWFTFSIAGRYNLYVFVFNPKLEDIATQLYP